MKISKVLIEDLHLRLHKNKEVWNISQVFKSTSSNQPPKDSETKTKEEIFTFIPISLSADFQVINSQVEVIDEDEEFYLQFEIPDIKLQIDTHRKNTIPLSLQILELPKTLSLQIGNVEKNYNLLFRNKVSTLKTKLVFFLDVLKMKDEKFVYNSEFLMKTENLTIQLPNETLSSFAEIQYTMKFNETSDSLLIKTFQVLLGKRTNLQVKGTIENISQFQKFFFESSQFHFNFDELGLLLKKLNLVNFEFSGILDFSKITLSGNLENLQVKLHSNGNNLFFKNSETVHSIKFFKLNAETSLNFKSQTPFFPYVQELKLEPLEFNYNSASVKLIANITDSLNANLSVENFFIKDYVRSLDGSISGKLEINGKKLEDLRTSLFLYWRGFQLPIPEFKTNYSNLTGRISGNLSFKNNFFLEKIYIDFLNVNLKNLFDYSALNVNANRTLIKLSPLIIESNLSFSVNLKALSVIFPITHASVISDLRSFLGNELSLSSNLYLNLEKGTLISANLFPKIPALDLNDLRIQVNTHLDYDDKGSIDIKKINVSAFNDNLKGEIKGWLIKSTKKYLADYEPHLNLNLQLFSEKNVKLNPNISFSGDIGLKLKFEKNLVTGNLYSNQSNFLIETGKCPSSKCKLFLLEGFQMNVPIQHDLELKSEVSLLIDEKSKFIQNIPITQDYNLSLKRIVGSHPFRENTAVEYVKQIGNEVGLRGKLEYKQNVFRLENLRVTSLNGYIYGKNIFLNLQPVFPNKLEYLATFQVRDVDLRELLKPSVAKRIDNGKITADINISGKNLTDFMENVHVFLSVYKLGRDFGKSALNVIMSSNLLQDYLITSYSVDKIEIELSRGLVYANVLFKPGILPTLFLRVENNQISLERMPLSNFLDRAHEEIKTYE